MRLADLTVGSKAVVASVAGENHISSRLMEMGLIPGATVEVMRKAPFGDPIQYRVCGACISMRTKEAACISVEDCPIKADCAAPSELILAAG